MRLPFFNILYPPKQKGLKSGYRLWIWLVLLGLLTAMPGTESWAKRQKRAKLFGARETRSNNIKPFKKWRGALDRYTKKKALQSGSCKENLFNKCHYQKWNAFLDKIRNKKPEEQIRDVNTYFNAVGYITDQRNWGVKDYWEAPDEFLGKKGDCEDFSIIKYLSLRRLGFKEKQLRVVTVQDTNLQVGHAILAVYLNDRILILDNQIKQVADHTSIHHYRPIFSINEKSWWRHRVAKTPSRR
ncbi:MAG: transglutaminase-like cysteine peptidase [Magnetococcales bacterium]|nr:transglutaminase-like cysteine peptidase [Magnetococcales bacterium]